MLFLARNTLLLLLFTPKINSSNPPQFDTHNLIEHFTTMSLNPAFEDSPADNPVETDFLCRVYNDLGNVNSLEINSRVTSKLQMLKEESSESRKFSEILCWIFEDLLDEFDKIEANAESLFDSTGKNSYKIDENFLRFSKEGKNSVSFFSSYLNFVFNRMLNKYGKLIDDSESLRGSEIFMTIYSFFLESFGRGYFQYNATKLDLIRNVNDQILKMLNFIIETIELPSDINVPGMKITEQYDSSHHYDSDLVAPSDQAVKRIILEVESMLKNEENFENFNKRKKGNVFLCMNDEDLNVIFTVDNKRYLLERLYKNFYQPESITRQINSDRLFSKCINPILKTFVVDYDSIRPSYLYVLREYMDVGIDKFGRLVTNIINEKIAEEWREDLLKRMVFDIISGFRHAAKNCVYKIDVDYKSIKCKTVFENGVECCRFKITNSLCYYIFSNLSMKSNFYEETKKTKVIENFCKFSNFALGLPMNFQVRWRLFHFFKGAHQILNMNHASLDDIFNSILSCEYLADIQ